jgi:tetratricopeptide (TPR) repeat protein
MLTRDLTRAERAFRQVLEVDGNNMEAYNRLAAIYLNQNRLDDARKTYEDIRERQEKPAVAETMIGTILLWQGRPKEARAHFERAVLIDPRAAVASNNLAWDYANTGGNLDIALQLAQAAKAQLPELGEISDTLGWIYYKKGLNALAVSTLQEAAKQNPENPGIRYRLGLAYLQHGDKAAARSTLQAVLTLNPKQEQADEARRVLATIKG